MAVCMLGRLAAPAGSPVVQAPRAQPPLRNLEASALAFSEPSESWHQSGMPGPKKQLTQQMKRPPWIETSACACPLPKIIPWRPRQLAAQSQWRMRQIATRGRSLGISYPGLCCLLAPAHPQR